ncbi:LPS translocon maturation chaperone LptM [Arsenophonus endosymbiont of Aleurodicus floccissimus]|uniref:LPS translocon maturation chaperone LptM n=1 Tax=Arsenophonus endosymbiont of Aleurodicus floccissimus TaxID=2152761 RepID=UPI000E6B43F8|nr:lipoprotein [Arsenophonus endosymbiont of Aleurodicus floccissimus]
MKKLLWLFITSIFLTLLSACGLKGPLYFPAKAIAEQKAEVRYLLKRQNINRYRLKHCKNRVMTK